jgi:hypothetical protein
MDIGQHERASVVIDCPSMEPHLENTGLARDRVRSVTLVPLTTSESRKDRERGHPSSIIKVDGPR